ncbi:MAG: hypothetical protein GY795_28810 [Desulfobacterales bacterium]|nr:hypothetical protein [Desulfobacterales bacterium]
MTKEAFFYRDIRCQVKGCPNNEFVTEEAVAGLIDGDTDKYVSDTDKFYVCSWPESDRKAVNADTDILEIRETEGISYDYAKEEMKMVDNENGLNKIPIKMEVKDAILLGVLYLVAAIFWLYGWFSLGMRQEFLCTFLVIAIILVVGKLSSLLSSYVKKHEEKKIVKFITSENENVKIALFFLPFALTNIYMLHLIENPSNNFITWGVHILFCFFTPMCLQLISKSFAVTSFDTVHNLLKFYLLVILTPFIFFFSSPYFWPMSIFSFFLLYILFCLYNTYLSLPVSRISQREKEIRKYLNAHPDLICKEHLLRPSMTKEAFFYRDIRCRVTGCPDNDFITVKTVAGLIGGDTDKPVSDTDKFHVSLWSESDKKAVNADIDILEIRETEGISYDYAINALLVTLKNDVSRPADFVKKIPVIIKGNPQIPEGAMKILKNEFGNIKKLNIP